MKSTLISYYNCIIVLLTFFVYRLVLRIGKASAVGKKYMHSSLMYALMLDCSSLW